MFIIVDYLNFLLIGYGISTIIFLVATMFIKRFERLRSEYLNVANLLALVIAVPVAIISAIGYYKNHADQAQNDLSFPGYSSHFYTNIFLTGVVPALFLFRRLRRKVAITLVIIAAVNWLAIYERLHIWTTSFYRDYLPSSWSVRYADSTTYHIVAATVVYFLFAFICAGKRKERLPSVK